MIDLAHKFNFLFRPYLVHLCRKINNVYKKCILSDDDRRILHIKCYPCILARQEIKIKLIFM